MVPVALAGMAVWAVAGLLLLGLRGWLADHGHTDWLWICVAGFLSGIPGLLVMRVHDANRRRRRAASDQIPEAAAYSGPAAEGGEGGSGSTSLSS
jgi:hypothetical protein